MCSVFLTCFSWSFSNNQAEESLLLRERRVCKIFFPFSKYFEQRKKNYSRRPKFLFFEHSRFSEADEMNILEWSGIPPVILSLVTEFLTVDESLSKVELVCRSWRDSSKRFG